MAGGLPSRARGGELQTENADGDLLLLCVVHVERSYDILVFFLEASSCCVYSSWSSEVFFYGDYCVRIGTTRGDWSKK